MDSWEQMSLLPLVNLVIIRLKKLLVGFQKTDRVNCWRVIRGTESYEGCVNLFPSIHQSELGDAPHKV